MPQALYQKYRPKSWVDLTGQAHIKTTLESEVSRGNLAHAYLFVGPRGVGKTTTARLLAKAANCQKRKKGSAEPCNECDSCVRMQAGRSFDLIEIDAASHTGVDHVREHILQSAEVSAGQGQYRVFIIDEVHMLSTAAFNAMLKMLEEPPAHVIFILATTEIHKVPATIISRCQRFDFHKIPAAAMQERLTTLATAEGVRVDDDVIRSIVEHADGSLRDAESTFGQVLALGSKHVTMDEASLVIPRSTMADAATLVDALIREQPGEAIALANKLVTEGISVSAFLQDIIVWLRGLMLAKVGERLDLLTLGTLSDEQPKLLKQSEAVSLQRLQLMIDVFMKRRQRLAEAPLPQLPLELAIIESTVTTVDDAAKPVAK